MEAQTSGTLRLTYKTFAKWLNNVDNIGLMICYLVAKHKDLDVSTVRIDIGHGEESYYNHNGLELGSIQEFLKKHESIYNGSWAIDARCNEFRLEIYGNGNRSSMNIGIKPLKYEESIEDFNNTLKILYNIATDIKNESNKTEFISQIILD